MQTTNANNQKNPAISSASIPGAHPKAAAVSPSTTSSFELETNAKKVTPPAPLLALQGWGLASYSSSDDEEDTGPARSAAAKKKAAKGSGKPGVKARAPSKDKYLLQVAAPQGRKEEEAGEGQFMSGTGNDDLLLTPFDPFADADGEDLGAGAAPGDGAVHLRVQQRNGRKTLTTVQGLSAAYSYPKILRDLKRELCCSGVVVEDEDLGSIIQLQGDHRKKVAAFLVKAGMVSKANVKVHGF